MNEQLVHYRRSVVVDLQRKTDIGRFVDARFRCVPTVVMRLSRNIQLHDLYLEQNTGIMWLEHHTLPASFNPLEYVTEFMNHLHEADRQLAVHICAIERLHPDEFILAVSRLDASTITSMHLHYGIQSPAWLPAFSGRTFVHAHCP